MKTTTMKPAKKYPFPLSEKLSAEIRGERFGEPFDGTIDAKFEANPWSEKDIKHTLAAEKSLIKATFKALSLGATDKEAMKNAVRAIQDNQNKLQAREAQLAAQGFTYSTSTGHFEKAEGDMLLSLYAKKDGSINAGLSKDGSDVAGWPVVDFAADFSDAAREVCRTTSAIGLPVRNS
jgi:hypothetical protein